MEVLTETVAWLADPAHWSGVDGIPSRVLQHLQLSGLALLAEARHWHCLSGS